MAGARILVLKQEGLRSFVEAEPAFAAIRASNPGVPIDLLTTPNLGRLAKGAPYFDRVLAAEPVTDKVAQKEFVSQLKRIGYEQIYDFDGTRATLDVRSAMTGLRGPRWIGPKRVVAKPGRLSNAFVGASLRRLLDDAKLPVEDRLPDLQWALSGRKDAANMQPSWFGISGAFCLLMPAANPARRWPATHYAQVAQSLARQGILAVIIGDEDVTDFAQEVAKHASAKGKEAAAGTVIDLTGKADLAQLAMLAEHAHFFLAGASDEMHLCVSLGCPGIVLVHPGDEDEADSLFGRDVIKLTANDISKLNPETALMMLRNMGLIDGSDAKNLNVSAK